MDHCFLFSQHLDEEGCLCLKTSQDGTLVAPLASRNFAEIKALQKDCETIIIESTINASILDLELPWLSERKARIAIPYALEDKVAESVHELHFSFDKLRYQNNHYTVAVISKVRILYIKEILNNNLIKFDVLTLDWFALSSQQLCINESILLINNDDFKGALSGELALNYIKKHPFNEPLFFEDSTITFEHSVPREEYSSYIWIAQNLLKTRPMNLYQGDILQNNTSGWVKRGYQIAGALCLVWLLSLLLVNALSLHFLNKKTEKIDQQIAVIYREFFPEAKQIISPKFRISQLIGSNAANSESRFWYLLNQFAKAMNDAKSTIEELRYQNKTLSVTLISADFASLEVIEKKLRNLQLNVKQTQASTRDQHVFATLELM